MQDLLLGHSEDLGDDADHEIGGELQGRSIEDTRGFLPHEDADAVRAGWAILSTARPPPAAGAAPAPAAAERGAFRRQQAS